MTYYKINTDTHSLYYSRVELNSLPLYEVEVTIENKVGMNDPEGETILNDLVLKGSFKSIKKIRSAKMLKFQITASSKQAAESDVKKVCNDLRIYNPMVSKVTFEAKPI
jgi:phosphoribosylformylglycinamidine synthase